MITGRIVFCLFGIRFIKIKRSIRIPENFEEMSTKQLGWWAAHFFYKIEHYFEIKNDKTTVRDYKKWEAMRIEMCRILSGVPMWLWVHLSKDSLRDMLYTWEVCGFLYKDKCKLKNNPLAQMGKLHGPPSGDFLVPWEFSFADAFFLRYKDGEKESDLNRMIAHLYRPEAAEQKIYTKDKREKYNHEKDDLWVDYIAKQPIEQRILVVYWYEQWRRSLADVFKHLFNKSHDKKAKKQGSWLPVLTAASNGVHNFEKIKYMNLMILLAELDRQMKQNKELEKAK